MKIQEFEQEIIFINYDFPSPDAWHQSITIFFRSPYDDTFENGFPNLKMKDLRKGFRSGKNYKKLSQGVRDFIDDLFFNGDDEKFSVRVNNIDATGKDKAHFLEKVRAEIVTPKPKPPYKKDTFRKLKDIEVEHNELVDEGHDGHPNLIAKHPQLKGKKIDGDANRLRTLRWSFSFPLFDEEDKVMNPRYVNAVQKKKALANEGVDYEIPDQTKERKLIDINKASISARGVLYSRIRAFHQDKQSSYIAHRDTCFIPNALDKNGNPIFDDELPHASITWNEEEGFKGKIHDPSTGKMDKPAPRLPDGQEYDYKKGEYHYGNNASKFAEIYFKEFMPVFQQLQRIMIDPNTGEWKSLEYKYGTYDDKIKKKFSDTIHFLRVKSSTRKAEIENVTSLTENAFQNDPDKFMPMLKKIEKKYKEYVAQDNDDKIKVGILKRWVDKRKEIYLEQMDNYWLCDELAGDYLDEYIEAYNEKVKCYNHKKNTNHPLMDGNKKKKRDIAMDYLQRYGWYYTIPNSHFRVESDYREPQKARERRIAIESHLWEIEEKLKDVTPRVRKKIVIKKKGLRYRVKKGMLDSIKEKWISLHEHPEDYSRPEEYKRFIKEVLDTENVNLNLPDPKTIKKNYKTKKKSKKEERIQYEKEIEDAVDDLLKIEDLKRELSVKDMKGCKKKGIITTP